MSSVQQWVEPQKKHSKDRITVEALKYYVPIFQLGEAAENRLLEEGVRLSQSERNLLETEMMLKQLALRKIADLSAPLITREINKIIAGSHLRGRDDLFDILYYAGLDGMRRGLRKFEVEKMNSSSTNYLFQWIVTYAKKELVVLEAPFGIPPSRFQRYKKISAVRKRLTEIKGGEYATNEEVLEYFQSGKADLATMNGRVRNKGKASMANRNIGIDIIAEQERFERNMMTVDLLDPIADYSSDVRLTSKQVESFSETVFGVFCDTYGVTDEARVVMMSDLNVANLTPEQDALVTAMDQKQYRRLSNQWKNLIRDKNGPFYQFLLENRGVQFREFDTNSAIAAIEAYDKKINGALYKVLFKDGE